MSDCQILISQILPGLSSTYLRFNPTLTASNCCQYDSTRFTCQNLKILTIKLPDSGIDGQIIPQIGNLTSLQTLDLSNNLLNGAIPDEIGKLQNLKYFSLQENQLMTGTIPSSLSNIDTLTYLDLKGTGFQGPLPSKFAQRNYTTGVLGTNTCPYESWLCTGTIPPRQPGCEKVCLQIGIPVLNDHNGPAIATSSATITNSQTITDHSFSTTKSTVNTNVANDNLSSSPNHSYLNYVIPIAIVVLCAVLAFVYRYGRKNYIVGGKHVVEGSLESLAQESTRIRESVLDRETFGGFGRVVGPEDDEVINVDLPQKTFVPKLFGDSQAMESEVLMVLEQEKSKANEVVYSDNPELNEEVIQEPENGAAEVQLNNVDDPAEEPKLAQEPVSVEVAETQKLPPHPHQSQNERFSFDSFHSFT